MRQMWTFHWVTCTMPTVEVEVETSTVVEVETSKVVTLKPELSAI